MIPSQKNIIMDVVKHVLVFALMLAMEVVIIAVEQIVPKAVELNREEALVAMKVLAVQPVAVRAAAVVVPVEGLAQMDVLNAEEIVLNRAEMVVEAVLLIAVQDVEVIQWFNLSRHAVIGVLLYAESLVVEDAIGTAEMDAKTPVEAVVQVAAVLLLEVQNGCVLTAAELVLAAVVNAKAAVEPLVLIFAEVLVQISVPILHLNKKRKNNFK